MTEIYNGYQDPFVKNKQEPKDEYHPKYPEAAVSNCPKPAIPTAEIVGYDCSANPG